MGARPWTVTERFVENPCVTVNATGCTMMSGGNEIERRTGTEEVDPIRFVTVST
jgi:hypothetical protein